MKKFAIVAATLVAAAAASGSAWAGKDLDAVKKRGSLICGVNTGLAGFSIADSQGRWTGLDVDFCRAVAAAIFGDANKVQFKPLSAQQRFTALQSGEIDILSRNTTWTLTRDAGQGMVFTGVTFYDGQGFMVAKKLGVKSAKQLDGAEVCVQSGTTTELNLTDFFQANKMTKAKAIVFDKLEEAVGAFFAGRCQVYTTDASGLAATRSKDAKNPDDYVILPELISKEPLGPSIRRGDDDFFAVVRWTLFAMLEAEEYGVSRANVDQMKGSSNPVVKRLLGSDPKNDMGKLLGLKADWAYQIVKQVGNYGDVFERNVGPKTSLKLERGLNALWNKGGLMYAPPVR
ncbi:MAG: amino acid ABC transporter substrate-binding protein [Rhodospirillaceae bacterium]|nr:amino acid ABC transporter substrate-binding protein [Rhodospirillaceae bacterium]